MVRESFDHSFTFEHTGISNPGENAVQNKKAQLDKFAESLEAVGYSCPNGLNSWNEAFKPSAPNAEFIEGKLIRNIGAEKTIKDIISAAE